MDHNQCQLACDSSLGRPFQQLAWHRRDLALYAHEKSLGWFGQAMHDLALWAQDAATHRRSFLETFRVII